jgi:hypothetical protein
MTRTPEELAGMPWYDSRLTVTEAQYLAWKEFEWLPPGWRKIFEHLVRRLTAIRSPERDVSFMTMTFECDEGFLEVDALCLDTVLRGIARKVRARSLMTCCVCGRHGLPRRLFGGQLTSLCPACAAPKVLATAIDEVSRLAGIATVGGRRIGADDVPEVLRSHFVRTAAAKRGLCGNAPQPTMDPATYHHLIDDLESLDARPSPSTTWLDSMKFGGG